MQTDKNYGGIGIIYKVECQGGDAMCLKSELGI